MTLMRFYLFFCGLIYTLLGVWCLVSHNSVAGSLGYTLPNATSEAEFIVVYGGLEVGVGMFLLLASRVASFARPALSFVAILHITLVLARLGTIATLRGFEPVIYNLLALEALLAFSACLILIRTKSQPC